jgi:hypothetical protein
MRACPVAAITGDKRPPTDGKILAGKRGNAIGSDIEYTFADDVGGRALDTMSRFYITIGPAALEGYPEAPRATLVVHAPDERAARADAELMYRREHPEVDELRLRLTPASEQPLATLE